jgi:hypothetical protein
MPGRGTRFTVRIPAESNQQPAGELVAQQAVMNDAK